MKVLFINGACTRVECQEGSGAKGKTVTDNSGVTKKVVRRHQKNPRSVPSTSQTVTDHPDLIKKVTKKRKKNPISVPKATQKRKKKPCSVCSSSQSQSQCPLLSLLCMFIGCHVSGRRLEGSHPWK